MTALKEKPKTSDGSTNTLDEAWVCIRVEPFVCPCGNFRSTFVTVQHLIVVWPSEDEPSFKETLEESNGGEAIEYEEVFGPCISWYELDARQVKGHQRRAP